MRRAKISPYCNKDAVKQALAAVSKALFVVFLVSWRKGIYSVLVNAVTNDGMFGAVDVLLETVLRVTPSHPHSHDMVNRYLYYALVAATATIINILTWGQLHAWLYWGIMMTTVPPVLNILLHTRAWGYIYSFVIDPLTKLFRFLLCSCVAYIINLISELSFDKHPGVSQSEIALTIQDKDLNHLVMFVKVFVITTILHYLEHRNIYYSRVFHMLYKYGSLMDIKSTSAISDPYPDVVDPKQKIIMVLLHRKWDYFNNPDVLKLLIRIYETTPRGKIFIMMNQILSHLGAATVKFSAVYTIGWLFDFPLLIPVMSSVLLGFTSMYKLRTPTVYQVCARCVGFAYAGFVGGVVTPALICEYADVCNNPLTRWLWIRGRDWSQSRLWKLYQYNADNKHIIWLALSAWAIYAWTKSPIAVALLTSHPQFTHLAVAFVCFGWFSDYALIHMITISAFTYLTLNIHNLPKVPARPLQITIITDYNDQKIDPDIPVDPLNPPIVTDPDDDFEMIKPQ